MRQESELSRAIKLLKSNERIYREQTSWGALAVLQRIRDQMEHGNLLLTAAVTQAIEANRRNGRHAENQREVRFSADEQVGENFLLGVTMLRDARETLADAEPLDGASLGSGGSRLGMLAATNLVGAYVFERIVPGLQSTRPAVSAEIDELLSELLAEMEARHGAGQQLRPTQYIYYWTARAMRATDIDLKLNAMNRLQHHLDEVFVREEGAVFGDRVEFTWIRDWLERERQLSESVTPRPRFAENSASQVRARSPSDAAA